MVKCSTPKNNLLHIEAFSTLLIIADRVNEMLHHGGIVSDKLAKIYTKASNRVYRRSLLVWGK